MPCIVDRIDSAVNESLGQKNSVRAHRLENAEERRAIFFSNPRGELFLHAVDRHRRCGELISPELSRRRQNCSSVGRIVYTLHQAVDFETVDELCDVGANALTAFCQRTQRDGFSRFDEALQGQILWGRQPDGFQRHLQLLLEGVRGAQEAEHPTVSWEHVAWRGRIEVERIVHVMNNTCN